MIVADVQYVRLVFILRKEKAYVPIYTCSQPGSAFMTKE